MAKQSKPSQPRRRLGRGLSSLIANSAELTREDDQQYRHVTGLPPVANVRQGLAQGTGDTQPTEIPVVEIAPNPFQPRSQFQPDELAGLAETIKHQGILQPLIVSPATQGSERPYVLVAGERRLRAARQLGRATVPCIVRQASPQQTLEWALIENIHRTDLNPMERANAYRQYMDRFGLSQSQAAERLGQPRATVTNHLRLLDLAQQIQQMLIDGSLSFGHGKVLAGLAGQTERQLTLARRIAAEGLSVRDLERLLAKQSAQPAAAKPPAAPSKPPYLQDLEQRLAQTLQTRVAILPGRRKNSGKIVIDFYSLDDFERITGRLGLQAEP